MFLTYYMRWFSSVYVQVYRWRVTTITRLVRFYVLSSVQCWFTFPQEQLPIAIRQYNGRTVEEVKQEIIGFSSDLSFAPPGVVIKWSWVSPATRGVESDLLQHWQF